MLSERAVRVDGARQCVQRANIAAPAAGVVRLGARRPGWSMMRLINDGLCIPLVC